MALIDDIEFYGRAVDAAEMERTQAATLLAKASNGRFTELGAARVIRNWVGYRARIESQLFDLDDALRAVENGRPFPEHVTQRIRERARANALRAIRRPIRRDEDPTMTSPEQPEGTP